MLTILYKTKSDKPTDGRKIALQSVVGVFMHIFKFCYFLYIDNLYIICIYKCNLPIHLYVCL